MKEPYQDDPSTNGVQVHDDETLGRLIRKAREKGMEVAVHAIGDLAFEKVLNAIEKHPPKTAGMIGLFMLKCLITN